MLVGKERKAGKAALAHVGLILNSPGLLYKIAQAAVTNLDMAIADKEMKVRVM